MFISAFMVAWLGYEITEAFATHSISNLRVQNQVEFGEAPVWFLFVFMIKAIALIGSTTYLSLFVVDLFGKK